MMIGVFTDEESVRFAMDFLKNKGFTDLVSTFDGNEFEHYDIVGMCKGKKYLIEVKRREGIAGVHTDNTCECYKVYKIRDAIKQCRAHGALLVSIYDNAIRVSNMLEPFQVEETVCGRKTVFEDKRKVGKKFALFRHYKEYRIRTDSQMVCSEGVDKNYNITLNTLL